MPLLNYFSNVSSFDEGKAHYRELVKLYHPDAGGDTATMQDINAEWDMIAAHLASFVAKSAAHTPLCRPAHPRTQEQYYRMLAAILKHARTLVPGARVYDRGSSCIPDRHICIEVPAQHAARAAMQAAGYRRHSAWKCWRRQIGTFDEWEMFISWQRGKTGVPFVDVVELEVAR